MLLIIGLISYVSLSILGLNELYKLFFKPTRIIVNTEPEELIEYEEPVAKQIHFTNRVETPQNIVGVEPVEVVEKQPSSIQGDTQNTWWV